MMPADFNPDDVPRFPPTDESGEVDITLIQDNLSKTVAERFEQHYAARLLVEQLRRAGEKFYGTTFTDTVEADRL